MRNAEDLFGPDANRDTPKYTKCPEFGSEYKKSKNLIPFERFRSNSVKSNSRYRVNEYQNKLQR